MIFQAYRTVAFLHWRIDPALVTAHLPPGLVLDTVDGAAWIGLTPFRVARSSLFALPAVPVVSSFHETNLRTYVRGPDGRDGLWFFSLDVDSLVNLAGGRIGGLPYFLSVMSVRDGTPGRYRSRRRIGRPAPTTSRSRHAAPSPATLGSGHHGSWDSGGSAAELLLPARRPRPGASRSRRTGLARALDLAPGGAVDPPVDLPVDLSVAPEAGGDGTAMATLADRFEAKVDDGRGDGS